MKPEIIVALDFADFEKIKEIVENTKEIINFYKVGLEAYLSLGNKLIEFLKSENKRIFLDLKFHDIPNTVKKAGIVAAKMDVDMFNIHIQGGFEMIKNTVSAVKEIKSDITLLGVTLLTSLNESYLNQFKISFTNTDDYVVHLAKIGKKAGLDGVVSSAKETPKIKEYLGRDFLTVTPGIRLPENNLDDQKRVVTPKDAKSFGTDFIVVGRPITQAKDPYKAAKKFVEELNG